ncbi:MAG: ECF-type sigma factor [Gemmatimonadales bacterium]
MAIPPVSGRDTPGTITDLLLDWREGRTGAQDDLVPLLYQAMRQLASRHLGRERVDHTLTPTALVHEAWLRLVDQARVVANDRVHFMAIVSRTMRFILVDHARRRLARKRQAPDAPLPDAAALAEVDTWAVELVAMNDALERLKAVDERLYRVVECRFFGGLSEEETGEVLGVSWRTVHRDWLKARSWLALALEA